MKVEPVTYLSREVDGRLEAFPIYSIKDLESLITLLQMKLTELKGETK